MMSAKMATPVLPKIKIFSNKGYVHDMTSKILSRDSSYVVSHVTKVW